MSLIDPIDLYLPILPQCLEGLTVAHLSDFHIRRPLDRHDRMIDLLRGLKADIFFLTGDYITTSGDEPSGLAVMRRICEAVSPRIGVFGVFGNHDNTDLRRSFEDLPVRWLNNAKHRLEGLPLEVIGFETDITAVPDSVAILAGDGDRNEASTVEDEDSSGRPVRLLLSHYPTYLPTAADLGVDLMFSGHTHGGQCRLPWGRALANSTDLPSRLTSGILRHKDTCCVVSRGLGENILPFRLFCPPHIPVYTIRKGPMHGERTAHIVNVAPW